MKGVILQCLGELVKENFGRDKWEEALERAGMDRKSVFLATQDVDDSVALGLLSAVCDVLNITLKQAADAFGEYWVCKFAPKIYRVYYEGCNSAKDFLLKMDNIHTISTKNIPNARPPRFEYEWQDDKTLVMKYKSHRGLIDIMIGLIKGVGKYYNENLSVIKLGDDAVKVIFP